METIRIRDNSNIDVAQLELSETVVSYLRAIANVPLKELKDKYRERFKFCVNLKN